MINKIIKECRPATLAVTIVSTTLGIASAYREGYIFKDPTWDIWRIVLITLAGLFLQCGTNLINNFFEEEVPIEIFNKRNESFWGVKRSFEEIVVFKTGLILFGVTAALGLYLSYYSGRQLFLIEVIGMFSAYAYSGAPFKYKNYGLGAIMSFIMMGPLMVYASFYVFSRSFSVYPILYSMALALFIPAVLVANELRDYEEDKRKGIGTLTVRIGFNKGQVVYYSLLAFAYINTLILIVFRVLPIMALVVFSTIPLLKKVKVHMVNNQRMLVTETAKIYLIFGMEFLIVLFLNN